MSVERNDPTKVHIECDNCGKTTDDEYDLDDFEVMIREAKTAGWQIRPGPNGWTHRCPACSSSGLDRQRKLLGF